MAVRRRSCFESLPHTSHNVESKSTCQLRDGPIAARSTDHARAQQHAQGRFVELAHDVMNSERPQERPTQSSGATGTAKGST